MNREEIVSRVRSRKEAWDIVVIGGGATGVGIAVDAASRGYDTVLFEQSDFGKGTSSRSTKLVHGGVRYLQQGNISLVMEALKERGILRENAPHLVRDLRFIVPNYDWWGRTLLRHRPQSLRPARRALRLRAFPFLVEGGDTESHPDPQHRRFARWSAVLRRPVR